MSRLLKEGIISEFCKYCDATEIPWLCALWCSVQTISTALGRDAFLDQGHYTVYPNMYIVLVAGSGRCRKSTAIGIAETFIKAIRPAPNIFSQKASVSALINALASVKHEAEGSVSASAEGIIIVDELTTLIDRGAFASGLISFLISLWDSKDSFEYLTRAHGKEIIYNSCVSILGGSTIEGIKDAIPAISIGAGFTSRIVFVYRPDHDKLMLRTYMSEENKERKKLIIHDLNEVAKIRGSYAIEEKAWKFLETEYLKFMKNSSFVKNRYLAGYSSRRHVMLFKLAMIVSASMNSSREIKLEDVFVARNILQKAEEEMENVLMAIASDEIGDMTNNVLNIITKHKTISRPLLLRLVSHRMQAKDLDVILDTLEQTLQVQIDGCGRKAVYSFKQIKREKKETDSFTENLLKRKDKKK